MTQIALLHSVLGIRPGVLDAAERLRADGHEVVVPDRYAGRVFDDYAEAMAFAEAIGYPTLLQTALDDVADLPDGFVVAGFSQGAALAGYVATRRAVSGALLLAGALPLAAYAELVGELRWPAGVPAQLHQTLGDPYRDQSATDGLLADVRSAGGHGEAFDYPGDGHLFTDASLPAEHDAAATELLWSRVLPFLRGLEV